MALRRGKAPPPAIVLGATHGELPQEVFPLVLELASCDDNRRDGAHGADFGPIESVAARRSFSVDGTKVRAHGVTRRGVGLEPHELRVMTVAFGRAPQHRPGEQRFAPERDEPLRIEIARMNRPQPHRRIYGIWVACDQTTCQAPFRFSYTSVCQNRPDGASGIAFTLICNRAW